MEILAVVSFNNGRLDNSSLRVLGAALRFAEVTGLNSVAVGIGDAASSEALSMTGADRNVLLSDPSFKGSDTGAVARIISAFMGCGEWITFCGDVTLSGYISGMLGIPHFFGLSAIDNMGNGIFLNDGFRYEHAISNPCCLHVLDSVEWGYEVNNKKIVEILDSKDLGLGHLCVGSAGSLTVSKAGENKVSVPSRHDSLLNFLGDAL